MRNINYRSDFDFILKLVQCDGKRTPLGVPDCDFTVILYTASKVRAYSVTKRGDEYTNFIADEKGIHVIANRHGLPPGRLQCELTLQLPSELYPDGRKRTCVNSELDCRLTADTSSCTDGTFTLEMEIPAIGTGSSGNQGGSSGGDKDPDDNLSGQPEMTPDEAADLADKIFS